jgi:hypothetical protein
MRSIGRPRRRNHGVGSIIGAVFVALIFLSGFAFYAVTQDVTQHYNNTISSMNDKDWNRNQEKIVIKQIAITSTNQLNVTAENDGSIQSHLIWLGIFNKTATPENQTYQALNEFVRPGETDNIVSNSTVIAGNKYVIQLVTELGNVIESKFYPASYVSCALTLVTAPPTVYQGNNVTVLLTVTPNDTVVDSIQSLTVTINATPTNLVQLVSNSPLSASSLMRGTSVFFWWIYNAANTGTVSFNATYLQAPAGTYALTNVNVLASPGQGGGGNVSITGVNGTAEYNPSQGNPLGATQNVSGSVADLASNDSNYMTFRSYQTASSGQTLYAHNETTNITGTPYHLQRLASPDGPATNLSVSMGTVGKQVWGNFVYPLTGVSSIPASVWGTTYSAWTQLSAPAIAFDSPSYVETSTAASSVSWSHTTGTGSNRLLLVAVGVHVASGAPTTVASVTYGGVPLTQVTTALYSAGNPQVRSYIFNLTNPASGTNTIAVTFAASTLYVCGAVTYSGVDQTNPIQTSNTATGYGTSQLVTVTVSGAGRAVFGHLSGHRTANTYTITEGSGQNNRWSTTTYLYKGRGSDKLDVAAGPTTMSWTTISTRPVDWVCSAVVINPATAVGHCNVDVLIRKSDNTVRTIIATNAAGSVDLTTTPSTITGAYSFPGYTVVDQTDYLEIDYYVQVTTAASGVNAYLRIDDPVLGPLDQTKTINVMLPSEYTAEVEFTGSSNLQTWTRLLWQVQSCWDVAQVTVTVQFYNFTLGNYTSNGNGYVSYLSSATSNTNELESQTETSSPNDFKNSTTGHWLMKIKGVKFANTQFLMKVDWIDLQTTYSTMGDTVSYNVWQWYSLKATTATGDPIPYAYVSVYVNGTSIALRNATDKMPITNPAWVRLDAVGEFQLEVKSASGSPQSFVLYAVVGSVVGQKTIAQEAP